MDDRRKRIEIYAYQLYEYRNSSAIHGYGAIGDDFGDWIQAEHIVDAEDRAKRLDISTITFKKMEG